ncbi:MAG TPA: lysophospholipid acyltransferase family protein [Acidimicrobiia bacterium]|jgi:1-acyl-sn-glycerol-3-phosphate acyltransferase|nr:lysophospholipid acyltransferase family protein [Acidimicrobiia bacterium]
MRSALHRFVLRPAMRGLTGFDVRCPNRLPAAGPAIVVANHNSHVDTALLLAAFPTQTVPLVRPVAAADYWFRNRVAAWLARRVLGAVPIDRSGASRDPLGPVSAALARGHIVVIFPEGTRGEPGKLGRFRSGVGRLAQKHPEVPVIPVWLAGCEEVLPRHGRWPRRRRCTVTVGELVRVRDADPRWTALWLQERVAELA